MLLSYFAAKFYFKQFWILRQVFTKRVFLVQNRKSSHHNWILHIRLRLGSKFQLKLTILIFWTKFAEKWYSKKFHFCMCPWSLLTISDLFARWPTDTTTLQCSFSFKTQRIRNAANIFLQKIYLWLKSSKLPFHVNCQALVC